MLSLATIVGTTNECAYLRDTTGNRRYWPVPVKNIDIPALKADRDQIFAEAVVRFRAGEKWWPTGDFEVRCIQPEQNDRLEGDTVDDAIAKHLAEVKARGGNITIGEMAMLLGAESLKVSMSEMHRIRRAMQANGER